MSKFPINAHRRDPYRQFKFQVKWDGKTIAGISKISGLNRITEVIPYREGGGMSNVSVTPGSTKYEPITLERGVTHDAEFEQWANLVFSMAGDADMSLKNYKKDILIELLNLQGQVVLVYMVYRCWVSEYQPLPELDANGNSVAIEKLVLQHEGWERDRAVTEPTES